MSYNDDKDFNKELLESLKESVDKLKDEVQSIKESLRNSKRKMVFDFEDDNFDNDDFDEVKGVKRKFRKRARRHKGYPGPQMAFNFRGLENLGRFISDSVNFSIGGLGESISEIVEGIMTNVCEVLDGLDFNDLGDHGITIKRNKPRRWRYGEEPSAVEPEKVLLALDEGQKDVLQKLSVEKLNFEQLKEATGLVFEELTDLLNNFLVNNLIIQETSGSKRYFITKFGHKHLTEEI